MVKFRFLPDVGAVGIAFEAFGKTERELLQNCALALEEAMVDTKTIRNRITESINIRGNNISSILVSLLEHLIFMKGAKRLLFKTIKLGVAKEGKSLLLQGFAYGERLDPEYKLKVDIKGVSRELFEVKKDKNILHAQVLLEH